MITYYRNADESYFNISYRKGKKNKRIGAANKETVEHKIVRQSNSEKIQQTKNDTLWLFLSFEKQSEFWSSYDRKEREIFSDICLPNTDCADVSLPPRGPEFSHKQKEVTLYA